MLYKYFGNKSTYTMICIFLIIISLHNISAKLSELERLEFCRNLDCDELSHEEVCGIRKENGKNAYKLFDNECLLLKYGCQVDDDNAYGIMNIKYCYNDTSKQNDENNCPNCQLSKKDLVCGIRQDGIGFRVKIFDNECELVKYNCQHSVYFYNTDLIMCFYHNSNYTNSDNQQNEIATDLPQEMYVNNSEDEENEESTSFTEELGTTVTESSSNIEQDILKVKSDNIKNIIVVDGLTNDLLNINKTIEDFFAATHVFDLPIKDMQTSISENTRRRLVKVFGPVKIFKPWIQKPKNVSEDYFHKPTVISCYHKCPMKCPDTYTPVCGMPGLIAREPSLMFKNHCYMDMAQCKMRWESKSSTSGTSAYIEASFVFCLGDELNGLYRFLPLIRTLQHMGRLKKKGVFKYKFRNMRFFNELLHRQPNIMG